MADQFITINTQDLTRYRRSTLKKLRGQIHTARRMFLNNMAFGARDLYIDYGVHRVMTVRNRNILRVSMKVTKAKRGREYATAGQIARGARYDALRQQEFGGTMKLRHSATKAARKDSKRNKLPGRHRFKGSFLTMDDIRVRGEKSRAHRAHVFLEMIQREKYKDPFVLNGMPGFDDGLMKLGKRLSARKIRKKFGYQKRSKKTGRMKAHVRKRFIMSSKIRTLRPFDKGQKRVRKRRWMKPSNDKLLRQMDPKMEWNKVMRLALKRR